MRLTRCDLCELEISEKNTHHLTISVVGEQQIWYTVAPESDLCRECANELRQKLRSMVPDKILHSDAVKDIRRSVEPRDKTMSA
jgi:uncharacterized protein with PIN domain